MNKTYLHHTRSHGFLEHILVLTDGIVTYIHIYDKYWEGAKQDTFPSFQKFYTEISQMEAEELVFLDCI